MTSSSTGSLRSVLADRAIRNVIVSQFIVMLGFGSALPILPLYARSFGVSYAGAGMFTSAFGLARLVGDLFAGALIDRYGERRMAPLGMIVVSASAILTGSAPTFPLAVAAWSLSGLGSAVMFGAQFSYLMKTVPQERMARTLGIFYGGFNIGIIVGGTIAGFVADSFGFRVPLFVYGAVMFVAMLFYIRAVPDPVLSGVTEPPLTKEEALLERDSAGPRRIAGSLKEMLAVRSFPTLLLVNFAYLWFVNSVFDLLVPLYAKEELGVPTSGIGALFAVLVVAELCVLYPAGVWADRFGRRAVLLPAMSGLIVVISLLGFAGTVIAFAVLLALLGVGSGTAGVPPAAMLSDIVPEQRSGLGVSMFRFAGDIAFFLGPLAVGATTDAFGFELAFILGAVPLALCLGLVLRMPETARRD